MNVRHDRLARVQARLRDEGLIALMILTHDDYRYLFGEDRFQPRALVPVDGPPTVIAFTGEEPEIRASLAAAGGPTADGDVLVFGSVGGQIHDVVGLLRDLAGRVGTPGAGRPRVGVQLWFETPAFLVDMFRKVNPEVEIVSSDAVMDPLRMVKDQGELALMAEAQRIAGLGMDLARQLLRPGVTAHEVAAEVEYAMRKAGAEGTSTPIFVTFGIDTCMLHGRLSAAPLGAGELAIVDLTPRVEGYCANLARTFVAGPPDARQRQLLDAYADLIPQVREAMRPRATVAALDAVVARVLGGHGLAEYQVHGIGHGLGLRFEETPASTIIPAHRSVPLLEDMAMTLGHTVLAIPGFGGVRHEDVYRVTARGGVALAPYPIDPQLDVA